MIALFFLFLTLSVSPFKSKSRLEAKNAALRHQLIALRRKVRGRVQLTNGDRLFLVLLYRWFPSSAAFITTIAESSFQYTQVLGTCVFKSLYRFSSWPFDLNGEANRVRKKQSSAIIAADGRVGRCLGRRSLGVRGRG